MPIPAFTLDGVIPPFISPRGPGDASDLMTPYDSTVEEIVARFSTSSNRCEILQGWLDHREALNALGVVDGFQLVDGSFVEDKVPGDVDVVTFFKRPAAASTPILLADLRQKNIDVFSKNAAKKRYRVDAIFVDMNAGPEQVVYATCYWSGLFSHRRGSSTWKGMVRVPLGSPSDDKAAVDALKVASATHAKPAVGGP